MARIDAGFVWNPRGISKFELAYPKGEIGLVELSGQFLLLGSMHGQKRNIRLFTRIEKRIEEITQRDIKIEYDENCLGGLCEVIFHISSGAYSMVIIDIVVGERNGYQDVINDVRERIVSLNEVNYKMGYNETHFILRNAETDSVSLAVSLNTYSTNPFNSNTTTDSGKYVMSISEPIPTLQIPKSQGSKYCGETGSFFLNFEYFDGRSNLSLQFTPFSPVGENLVLRYTSDELDYFTSSTEIVIKYESTIRNEGHFYTDSNGFYDVRRKSWTNGPYVDSNYYPISNFAWLNDEDGNILSMNVERAEAVSSLAEGSLEFVVNRMSYGNERRGNNENANEYHSSNLAHRINLYNKMIVRDTVDEFKKEEPYRKVQKSLDNPLIIWRIEMVGGEDSAEQKVTLKESLNQNDVYLASTCIWYTMDTRTGSEVIIRAVNTRGRKVIVNLKKALEELFAKTIESSEELSADYNETLSELKMGLENNGRKRKHKSFVRSDSDSMEQLEFNSYDIRSFILNFA